MIPSEPSWGKHGHVNQHKCTALNRAGSAAAGAVGGARTMHGAGAGLIPFPQVKAVAYAAGAAVGGVIGGATCKK